MSAAPGRPKQARTAAAGEGTAVRTAGPPEGARHHSVQHEGLAATAAASRHVWSLRTHLSVLLVLTMLLTFTLVGGLLLVHGIPGLEDATRQRLWKEVTQVSERMELLVEGRQDRLALLGWMLHDASPAQAAQLLEEGLLEEGAFRAVYHLSPQGRLLAVGLPTQLRARREDLVGTDLSSNRLFQAVTAERPIAWSGRFLSLADGTFLAALAVRGDDGHVVVGEVPLDALLGLVSSAAGVRSSAIWVADQAGEVLADSEGGRDVGQFNMRSWPLLQASQQGRPAPRHIDFRGRSEHAAAAYAPGLDWHVIAHAPAGLGNPDVRRLLLYVAGAFGTSLLLGLLVAPFWAARMARPLQKIVARTEHAATGEGRGQPWPRGSVLEFNALSTSLQAMATTLEEREQKSQAIFNAAPVPMAVVSAEQDACIVDVNDAWCREFRRPRGQVLGARVADLRLFPSPELEARLVTQLRDGHGPAEARLLRGDGQEILVQVFPGKHIAVHGARFGLWAAVDIGPVRRIEEELRTLNHHLEARVAQRTQALAASNATLSQTAEELQRTQGELVQAEKMAALGSLVAGVAHELNTPLGNSVMAVSAMEEATRSLEASMQQGLTRSALLRFIDSVAQGTDIAGRNLRRAADLVQNFKQVAVDQTSAQRRKFELYEVVHEMVVSLRPSFSRTPYRITVEVPATGMRLDSYPGALGQAIGNLIQNAVVHGFDGRDHGEVHIAARRAGDGRIVLRVADDGRGIAAEHLPRIFEPFMSTKMGRGGTGLGLHICHNAVVNLLGGTLAVQSTPGVGTCFEMHLPAEAPRDPAAAATRSQPAAQESAP